MLTFEAKPVQARCPTFEVKPRASRGQHQPRPLAFDPTKLKGLSEKLIRSHWENNYGGAVKALNAVEQRLATIGASANDAVDKVRRQGFSSKVRTQTWRRSVP